MAYYHLFGLPDPFDRGPGLRRGRLRDRIPLSIRRAVEKVTVRVVVLAIVASWAIFFGYVLSNELDKLAARGWVAGIGVIIGAVVVFATLFTYAAMAINAAFKDDHE